MKSFLISFRVLDRKFEDDHFSSSSGQWWLWICGWCIFLFLSEGTTIELFFLVVISISDLYCLNFISVSLWSTLIYLSWCINEGWELCSLKQMSSIVKITFFYCVFVIDIYFVLNFFFQWRSLFCIHNFLLCPYIFHIGSLILCFPVHVV